MWVRACVHVACATPRARVEVEGGREGEKQKEPRIKALLVS